MQGPKPVKSLIVNVKVICVIQQFSSSAQWVWKRAGRKDARCIILRASSSGSRTPPGFSVHFKVLLNSCWSPEGWARTYFLPFYISKNAIARKNTATSALISGRSTEAPSVSCRSLCCWKDAAQFLDAIKHCQLELCCHFLHWSHKLLTVLINGKLKNRSHWSCEASWEKLTGFTAPESRSRL